MEPLEQWMGGIEPVTWQILRTLDGICGFGISFYNVVIEELKEVVFGKVSFLRFVISFLVFFFFHAFKSLKNDIVAVNYIIFRF